MIISDGKHKLISLSKPWVHFVIKLTTTFQYLSFCSIIYSLLIIFSVNAIGKIKKSITLSLFLTSITFKHLFLFNFWKFLIKTFPNERFINSIIFSLKKDKPANNKQAVYTAFLLNYLSDLELYRTWVSTPSCIS